MPRGIYLTLYLLEWALLKGSSYSREHSLRKIPFPKEASVLFDIFTFRRFFYDSLNLIYLKFISEIQKHIITCLKHYRSCLTLGT